MPIPSSASRNEPQKESSAMRRLLLHKLGLFGHRGFWCRGDYGFYVFAPTKPGSLAWGRRKVFRGVGTDARGSFLRIRPFHLEIWFLCCFSLYLGLASQAPPHLPPPPIESAGVEGLPSKERISIVGALEICKHRTCSADFHSGVKVTVVPLHRDRLYSKFSSNHCT